MIQTLQRALHDYPRQYWLMFWGMLVSTIGSSMIWPFLMVYISERLDLPLTVSASMMTINSISGIAASFLAGPVIDRAGRKWVMAVSLLGNGLGYLLFGQASGLPAIATVMVLNGAFNPLYRIAADAMMADLVPPEKRADAYALMRMSNNLGIAIGPSLGGLMASLSYGIAFLFAAVGMTSYSLLITFFGTETLPGHRKTEESASPAPASGNPLETQGGYQQVLRDRPYLGFVGTFTLVQICAALIWVLLAVYAKENYGLPESLYGLLPTTNAILVVVLQYGITQWSKKYPPLRILALGAAIYAAATLSVAFGRGFWAFWSSMVVMTLGELILVPTSSTYAANLAPAEQRGRYMSLYSLTWMIAAGIGPVFGGWLNDTLGPQFIWYGGGLVGLTGCLAFLALQKRTLLKEGA